MSAPPAAPLPAAAPPESDGGSRLPLIVGGSVVLALLVVGWWWYLSSVLSNIADEQSPPPSATSESSAIPAGFSDAERAALIEEGIATVYSIGPQPAWLQFYVGIAVEDGRASVTTTLPGTDPAMAESMCRDIAARTHDIAEPTGVTNVLIYSAGGAELTDCLVP